MAKKLTNIELTQATLKEALSYDPLTGVFVWTKSRKSDVVGRVAGSIDNGGYNGISIGIKRYSAHRLAWLYVYGAWPNGDIDHINGIRDDNRIVNLRNVTSQANHHNRRGAKGYSKHRKRWHARIVLNKKSTYLGSYSTEEEARGAYLEAKKVFHPTSPINSEGQL